MIVLCVGMYRACSTWQYGVASQILERNGGARRLGFIEGIDFDRKLDLAALGDERGVLKAHDAHRRFADELQAGRALGLYAYRDLRDVIYSYIHKTGLTFEQLAERGFFELCLENDRFWRSQPGLIIQTYEDLTAEPARGVAEIAAHLGVELADGEAAEIADSLSFEANRKRTEAMTERLKAEGNELSSQDQSRFDPVTLLHWNHLRKGQTGGWRELASPEQRGLMAHYFGPWLASRGYEADAAWAPTLPAEQLRRATIRLSFAPNREDILLDRIFLGRKGTYLDIDAFDPIRSNKTYYFYLRGWRGVNVGISPSPRDRFVEDRPADLNLGVRLPYDPMTDEHGDGPPIRGLADLIAEHRIVPPEVVAFSVPADPAPILADLPLATWKPSVLIVETRLGLVDPEAFRPWEATLLGLGYLPAAVAGPNRIYLRADLESEMPELGRPVGVLDNYAPAEPPVEIDEEGWRRVGEGRFGVEATPSWRGEIAGLLAIRRSQQAEVNGERHELAAERDRHAAEAEARRSDHEGWHRERAGWEAEREALRPERMAWTARQAAWESDRAAMEADRARLEAELRREAEAHQALERRRVSELGELDFTLAIDREAAIDAASLAEAKLARAEQALARAEADRVRVEADRDRLAAEVGRLEAELARHASEAEARDLAVLEAQRTLRPYRLIDRFGVVGSIHRRVRPLKRFFAARGGIHGPKRPI